jgi:hypothetical protein
MSRSCTVCNHPSAATIAVSLMEGRSARAVAATYVLSYAAMKRHARNHVTPGSQPTHDPAGAALEPLDELIASLRGRALAGSDAAAREYRLALAAQSQRSSATTPEYNVLEDPEWIKLQRILLDALVPFPEARIAISDAIRGYEEATVAVARVADATGPAGPTERPTGAA